MGVFAVGVFAVGVFAVGVFAVNEPATAADDATAAEVRGLARRALQDPAALDALRDIHAIDGRPAGLRSILDADAGTLEARLRTLASTDTAGSVDSDRARSSAAEIVSEFETSSDRQIGWFERAVETLREWLEFVLEPLQNALALPMWALTFVSLAAVLIAAVVAVRLARRATRAGIVRRPRAEVADRPLDPAELESRADAAERQGDFEAAIRLRFAAGLLRLDEAGIIAYRPSMTTREIARAVKSPVFAALTKTFDEIVYGRRRPKRDDAEAARRDWASLRSQPA